MRSLVHQELERAGIDVARSLDRRDGRLAHAAAQVVVEQRRGRLLHDLLVPPLHRALALEEVHGIAVHVAKHLELDVVRVLDQLLQVDTVVAKGVHRLAPGGFEGVGSRSRGLRTTRMPLPPPPAVALTSRG